MAKQTPQKLMKVAAELDRAMEKGDIEEVLGFFADDCEIEMIGMNMKGRKEARKWVTWLFGNLSKIKFEPLNIMAKGDTFFEEFTLKAKLRDGREVRSRMAEVLDFENYRVKSLRIYFNIMDFAQSGKNFLRKAFVHKIITRTLKGIE